MNEIVAKQQVPPVDITTSRNFPSWLAENRVSLAFSAGPSGKLFLVGLGEDSRLSIFERGFDAARGLAIHRNSLIMSAGYQIWRFENALADGEKAAEFDRLYVPRVAYTTGDLRTHDLAATDDGDIMFVNTLFSCLARVSSTYSFVPVWRPPFVTEIAPDDRCHLMGLAMQDGKPRFVTAAARSDEADGWLNAAVGGGCVIDVGSGDILAKGLSLPCSPRLHDGDLWLHEAGNGYLGRLDLQRGKFEPVTFLPGFVRGLAFIGHYAVATSSRLWEGEKIDHLPLSENLQRYRAEARCAVLVVDLRTGELVEWLRVEGTVKELFDIALLPDVVRPAAIGLRGEDIRRVLSIAPEPRATPR